MKTLIAALALMIPALATADPLPKPVADMECLVGAWKVSGAMTMGKDTAKVTGTWDCKRTAGKFGVLCTLALRGIPGVPIYTETALFGYEPHSNTAHWFAVTNAGETHDHVAKPAHGNTIEFVYRGTQEGKPFKEVITLELVGKNALNVRSEQFVAGKSAGVLEGKARK